MTQVVKITEEKALELTDLSYDGGSSYYGPKQDASGNWIISVEEAEIGNIHGELIEWDSPDLS